MKDSRLLVGLETSDDAGVYLLNEETALIQTLDFFTPIVDDPYRFGQIAAANALSDIYAMGGRPLTAMNIIGYPTRDGDLETLARILAGGADKVKEAGALIVGGHSVEDKEPKYGLSVTGIAHPERITRNSTARPGDRLVLTKPLGTGVVATAVKAKLAPPELQEQAAVQMATLNQAASAAMQEVGAHACTDITGFGLLGHTFEMAKGSAVGIVIEAHRVPVLPQTLDFAAMGLLPGGVHANRSYLGNAVSFDTEVPLSVQDLMFDPQTSGGLLIAVAPEKVTDLLDRLFQQGVSAAEIGWIEAGRQPGTIHVQP
jgi:selenide,water dikinase